MRAWTTSLSMIYIDEHECEIEKFFDGKKDSSNKSNFMNYWFVGWEDIDWGACSSYKEAFDHLVETCMMARISLLKTALEHYIKSEFKDARKGYNRVEAICDVYRLRCHKDHDAMHVLEMLNAFRGDVVHKVEKREMMACPETTFSILKQNMAMVWSYGQRSLVFGDKTSTEVVSRAEKICKQFPEVPNQEPYGLMIGRFVDVLHKEVVDCIEAYDAVKALPEARGKLEIRKKYMPIHYE
jgi:hypothetical protein